jgi:hypothetical protein
LAKSRSGVVCSADESVASPAGFWLLGVAEQPAITKVRAPANANRVRLFKAILPPAELDND